MYKRCVHGRNSNYCKACGSAGSCEHKNYRFTCEQCKHMTYRPSFGVECGKPVGLSENGIDRGLCCKPKYHSGTCSSNTCRVCGVALTKDNKEKHPTDRRCNDCASAYQRGLRRKKGISARNIQHPGERHTFPCGCSGVLPELGLSNSFAQKQGHSFVCRVRTILNKSVTESRAGRYSPIDPETPHAVIREMMTKADCVLCHEPLTWELGKGKTPHLHHDHETGEPYGFTHSACNPKALQKEVTRLFDENNHLVRTLMMEITKNEPEEHRSSRSERRSRAHHVQDRYARAHVLVRPQAAEEFEEWGGPIGPERPIGEIQEAMRPHGLVVEEETPRTSVAVYPYGSVCGNIARRGNHRTPVYEIDGFRKEAVQRNDAVVDQE